VKSLLPHHSSSYLYMHISNYISRIVRRPKVYYNELMLSLQSLYRNYIKKELPYFCVLSILIILASVAMFHDGFFRTFDDVTTVRIIDMAKELQREGWYNNFPVRMSAELSHGFGYPLYLFYGNLPYYVGALIKMITGINHISVTKLVYLFPLVAGPILFYAAARFKMKPFYGLIAGCLYTLFPYRGYGIYIKGGTGEAWAMAFMPGLFIGLFLMENKKSYGLIVFAIFFLLSVISHPLAGLQAVALAVLYGLFFIPQKRQFLLSVLLGLGLAAFNLIPSFYYLKTVQITFRENNITALIDNLVPWHKLVVPDFVINVDKPFSSLFFPIIIFGLIAVCLNYKTLNGKKMWPLIFFGIISLTLYLLVSDSTRFFWTLTQSITGVLQTSTRLFTILSFTIPFFVGLYLPLIANKLLRLGLIMLVIFVSLSSLAVFKPVKYSYFYEYKAEGPCATTTWQDEYLPKWVKVCPPKELQANMVLQGDGKLVISKNTLLDMEAVVVNKKPSDLIVHRYYFPGWDIYMDGQKSKLDYTFSPYGIFKTKIPEGTHKINVVYRKTLIMVISDIITLVSIVILMLLSLKNNILRSGRFKSRNSSFLSK